MFKTVFSLNQDLLKKFLISVLRLDINPKNANLILENNELNKSIEKEYHKTVDILVSLNSDKDDIFISIDIELNSSKPEDINFRNYLYLSKILTTNIEQGSEIKKMDTHIFIQLNLNIHKFKDNTGEKIFGVKKFKTNEDFVSNVRFVCKSLYYYYNFYYTNNKLVNEEVIWLSLLNLWQ